MNSDSQSPADQAMDLDALVRRRLTSPDAPLSEAALRSAEAQLKRRCRITLLVFALAPIWVVVSLFLGWKVAAVVGIFPCFFLVFDALFAWSPVARPLYFYPEAWHQTYEPIGPGDIAALDTHTKDAPVARATLREWLQRGVVIRKKDFSALSDFAMRERVIRKNAISDSKARSAILANASD